MLIDLTSSCKKVITIKLFLSKRLEDILHLETIATSLPFFVIETFVTIETISPFCFLHAS